MNTVMIHHHPAPPAPAAGIERLPVVEIPVSSLRTEHSPRRGGLDEEHVRALVDIDGPLPPILVHAATRRVIDGTHRVRAAVLRGERLVPARVLDIDEAEAFVLSVRLNVTHGLPLSRADRAAAVERIVETHPEWSNRMIASATGLAASTVGELRRRSGGGAGAPVARLGRDGRVRPTDPTAGRLRVQKLLARDPDAPIRRIATEAGVSPSTAHDVRTRLRAGRSALPADESADRGAPADEVALRRERNAAHRKASAGAEPDVANLLAGLMRDPSLRFSETGRGLLRWLGGQHAGIESRDAVAGSVPDHCAVVVAKLARGYATAWVEFAAELDARICQVPG